MGSQAAMKVLLITPPMTQLNTPYPAIPVLTQFLRTRGVDAVQADASLELALRLFSPGGLRLLRAAPVTSTPAARHFHRHADAIREALPAALRILRHKPAPRPHPRFPEGPHFEALRQTARVFGGRAAFARNYFNGTDDPSYQRHLASLFIDDLADAVRDLLDPRFELSRYAESIALAAPSFCALQSELNRPLTAVDRLLRSITRRWVRIHRPGLVAFSVPFPGNLYGALRMARFARDTAPGIQVVIGGGYINTELRALRDARIFDIVDFITLDRGEWPLTCLVEYLQGRRPRERLCRTFTRDSASGKVCFIDQPGPGAPPPSAGGMPCLDGLPLRRYLSFRETPNPMLSLWSDGRWNKLTLAHGCYWARCAFCDTSLDYIRRFAPVRATETVRRMAQLIRQTGENGFHFTDEAAPPALLEALSQELLRRGLDTRWWTNVRFDRHFTLARADIMAKAGCIAVTGGLEGVTDRMLRRVRKGTTLAAAVAAMRQLATAGIGVHAYLMYGFPGQTMQDTVDALEIIRRLFIRGWLHSSFWHRFALTVHSPIYKNPRAFDIHRADRADHSFANNEVAFEEKCPVDHEALGRGIRRAAYNYNLGMGLDLPVKTWFDIRVPRPHIPPFLR
jgi:hypothetical protein